MPVSYIAAFFRQLFNPVRFPSPLIALNMFTYFQSFGYVCCMLGMRPLNFRSHTGKASTVLCTAKHCIQLITNPEYQGDGRKFVYSHSYRLSPLQASVFHRHECLYNLCAMHIAITLRYNTLNESDARMPFLHRITLYCYPCCRTRSCLFSSSSCAQPQQARP